MKIYFAASIKGGRGDVAIYRSLIQHLTTYGTVLTEHVGDSNLSEAGEQQDDSFIHNRDLQWLFAAHAMVAEVSIPSTGAGYELGRLVERIAQWQKVTPILCLYRQQEGKKLSSMIRGCRELTVCDYRTLEEALLHIDTFMVKHGFQKK